MSARTSPSTDDPAFVRFYRDHYPAVFAYCRRRLRPGAAEDAVAEAFAAAWRKWGTVPSGDGAIPWLYGVAHREVLHQWRSAARYRRLIERLGRMGDPMAAGPDHVVVQGAEAELAREALMRLRPPDREVLQLALWEGLPHTEIAVVLGLSENAVAARFLRAKQRVGREYRALERRHLKPASPPRREVADDQ